MPCNWSTTASVLLRSLRNLKPKAFWDTHASLSFVKSKSQVLTTSGRGNTLLRGPFHTRTRTFASLALAPHTPISGDTDLVSATARLSAAQVSRAAAQAVRLCIRDGGFGDALYVINSACHSVLGGALQSQESRKNASEPQLKPLSFGRPISPRLAAHAFLHGLVRGGYTKKAGIYATLMMQVGIPIRPRTLESVVNSVISPLSARQKLGPFARVTSKKRFDSSPIILQLRTSIVSNECARAALELLLQARTFGQQRTERMYRVLFETLLMQGEIIVASLLFVLLVKDWELRKAQQKTTEDVTSDTWVTHDDIGVPRPSHAALLGSPYPDLKAMGSIVELIERMFKRIPDSSTALLPYLQSLALFAMLLDTGQLHTHRVASVISALYSCPKTDARVWILQGGYPVLVEAYPYFHDVLKRLIQSLSTTSSRPAPDLSRRAYNSLLSYSLRHQLSPKMASQVLHHMCVERTHPIPPDIVTYNILLRSGTLLRQMYISEMALAALRKGFNQEGVVTSDDLQCSAPGHISLTDISTAVARFNSETLVLPKEVLSPAQGLRPNEYTFSSVVKYLTSSGRADVIADTLFDMLPELRIIDHPATNGKFSRTPNGLSRNVALKRAVRHGPYVYSAVIDALVKAGEIGLAERVFILAQQAQRASHVPGFAKNVAPWCLTVHAYTSMMQCYAAVARGRLSKHKLSRYHVGSVLLERDLHWTPKARNHRQGYAAYVHEVSRVGGRSNYTKRQSSKRNGSLLYRSMLSGGGALLQSLVFSPNVHIMRSSAPNDSRGGTLPRWTPRPDARFFKAALKLFVHPDYARRRGQHGKVMWSPMLHKLAAAMVLRGFDIPRRYRHLLIWKWKGRLTSKKRQRAPACLSNVFSKVSKGQRWHKFRTVKTRGLPIRERGTWKRRPRTTGCSSDTVS